MLAALVPTVLAISLELTPTQRGTDLYHSCKINIKMQDDSAASTQDDIVEAERCISYIGGFLDGNEPVSPPAICVENASIGTISRIYVAYMDAHPKLMDEYKGFGFSLALLNAYPCTKRK